MSGFRLLACVFAVGAASLHAQGPPARQPAAPQTQTPPPAFRAGTLVVPLDVRVLDRLGKPVTDLTAADFTITEDKVPQRITQFVKQSYEPSAPTKLTVGDRFTTAGSPAPAARRVFLIVLGRGRLQPPAKGVDGAIRLVQDLLLPQDHVAVLAWDRATDFTTDHASIISVLKKFKAAHESIEAKLRHAMSGLAGVYGSRDIPPSLRGEVDAVFDAGGTRARTVSGGPVPNASRLASDERRIVDAFQRAEVTAGRENVLREAVDPLEAAGVTTTFDEYIESNVQSMHDLNSIYRGVEYLRYLSGEKHLVFISPDGIVLPRAEDDRSLAATAADARVVLDIIHTGGTPPTGGISWNVSTARTLAELTGGYFTSVSYATRAVERIDGSSRFAYVLGYSPTNASWDGKYRRIAVRVNRPGVTVHYRHGYFGGSAGSPMGGPAGPMKAEAARSLTRIAAATRYGSDVKDIELAVTASPSTSAGGAREVLLEMTVSTARMIFEPKGDRQTGAFDLAVFIGDERQQLVGQTWQKIDLSLEPERFARFRANGLPVTLRLGISRSASFAKVIVYDYGSDLLGSAHVKVKKK